MGIWDKLMQAMSGGRFNQEDPNSNWLKPAPQEMTTRQSGAMMGATDGTLPTQQTVTAAGELSGPPRSAMTLPPVMGSNTPNPPSFDLGGKRDDSDIKALLDQINEQGLAAVGDQRGSLKEKEQMLKDYMQTMSPQTDFSPLMALVDTWYGGNLSKGYTKPMSGADVFGGSQGLQGGIDKARLGVSATESEKLKQELQGRLKLRELEAMEANKRLMKATTQDLANKNYDFKVNQAKEANREKFEKTFGPQLEQANILNRSVNTLKAILQKGGKIPYDDPIFKGAASALATAYNTGIAKLGALAGADLNLIERGTGVSTSIRGLLETQFTGSTPENMIQQMENLQKVTDQVMDLVDQKQKDIWQGSTDNLMKTARDAYGRSKELGIEAAGGGTSTPDYSSAADAELKRRGLK
jgi:hypothetical protein